MSEIEELKARIAILEDENSVLRVAWAEVNNSLRHKWFDAINLATEELFSSMSASVLFSKIRREQEKRIKELLSNKGS